MSATLWSALCLWSTCLRCIWTSCCISSFENCKAQCLFMLPPFILTLDRMFSNSQRVRDSFKGTWWQRWSSFSKPVMAFLPTHADTCFFAVDNGRQVQQDSTFQVTLVTFSSFCRNKWPLWPLKVLLSQRTALSWDEAIQIWLLKDKVCCHPHGTQICTRLWWCFLKVGGVVGSTQCNPRNAQH